MRRSQTPLDGSGPDRETFLVEDNAARAERRTFLQSGRAGAKAPIVVRLHRICDDRAQLIAELAYPPGSLKHRSGGRATLALSLLDEIAPSICRPLIVAGSAYGSNRTFLREVLARKFDLVMEVRPSLRVKLTASVDGPGSKVSSVQVSSLFDEATWEEIRVRLPQLGRAEVCRVASLGTVEIDHSDYVGLFTADVGAIRDFHPGIMIAVSNLDEADVADLIRALYWVRWIRPFSRRKERRSRKGPAASKPETGSRGTRPLALQYRSNIALARLQDESAPGTVGSCSTPEGPRGLLAGRSAPLSVVELFAGAGGMGLGFLLAERGHRRFRLVFSGELHPIYVETLKINHKFLASMRGGQTDFIPRMLQSVDLNSSQALDRIASSVRESGGVDILIGGPPCQGFSSANRNSWSRENPHNRLVDVFMRYVEGLKPPVFLMENVQGISWTAKDGADGQPSVAKHMLSRMKSAGYLIFAKLLDAVWYGVPQYRTRLFLLGLRQDLGYSADDFGSWGPFPPPTHGPLARRPLVTVNDAISDLPRISNGHRVDDMSYSEPRASQLCANGFLQWTRSGAPRKKVWDHVTSRHADYVIERYRRIPPGGNWRDIIEMMSNYADLSRTHSNIYRRLVWEEPAITIGHYRKSMLIHPSQNRGLSLREAARLQSFPDWFRFVGNLDGAHAGLMHKQQQLANAVCPLVTKAMAEFILRL